MTAPANSDKSSTSLWLVVFERCNDKSPCIGREVAPGESVVIGRDPLCDVVLCDPSVSRRHVQFSGCGNTVSFEDLGSQEGLTLNGELVMRGELAPGERLRVGQSYIGVEMKLPRPSLETASAPGYSTDFMRPFHALLDKLRQMTDIKEMLTLLLTGSMDTLGAARGYVLLTDGAKDTLAPVATAGTDDPTTLIGVSTTIYRQALRSKRALVIANTTTDALCKDAPSLIGTSGPLTVLCSPLLVGNEAIGVLYLDLPLAPHLLNPDVLTLLSNVAGMTASFVSQARTRTALLREREKSSRLNALRLDDEEFIIGHSENAKHVGKLLDTAAPMDVSVLITGETGTGKELAARYLHRRSQRSSGPFVPINCAALPQEIAEAELFGAERGAFTGSTARRIGYFEAAQGGTLFLDEVGEISAALQVKLLRALEERTICRLGGQRPIPVDFRLVCATNSDLEEGVRNGTFRSDLFFRINVFHVTIPPLRDRTEDIPIIARHLLTSCSKKFRKDFREFSESCLSFLEDYAWPGNVRELKNVIERAVIIEEGKCIEPQSLGLTASALGRFSANPSEREDLVDLLPYSFEKAERLFLEVFFTRALEKSNGNIAKAARSSGITRNAIYRRLDRIGLGKKTEQ